MAGRPINKLHQDDVRKNKFYVYEIYQGDQVAYIGKGSGRRLEVQKRKFNAEGKVVAWFDSEKKAYAYEVEQIAKKYPFLNKCKGGNGNKATKKIAQKDKWTKNLEAVGTRKYAALLWLKYAPVGNRSQSTLEQIREVAYG